MIRIAIFFRKLWESYRVAWRYWRSPRFLLLDLNLGFRYVLRSSFGVSKRAPKPCVYGETPLTTLDRIARECRLLSKDVVYELGCGTGRTCFWLASFVKCHTVGIDFNAHFIDKARRVACMQPALSIEFREGDMFQTDLKGATAIYLYGTCLEDEEIDNLCERFRALPKGTKIITVSYPLTDYSDAFTLEKEFSATYPWGTTSVYLNRV